MGQPSGHSSSLGLRHSYFRLLVSSHHSLSRKTPPAASTQQGCVWAQESGSLRIGPEVLLAQQVQRYLPRGPWGLASRHECRGP